MRFDHRRPNCRYGGCPQSPDEDLLDSGPCIKFLMRLLGPGVPQRPERSRGLSSIGAKLMKLSAGSSMRKGATSGLQALDAGEMSVRAKVEQLFGRNKGVGNRQDDHTGWLHGEEVSSKWLALLTLEKACISTVVLEGKSFQILVRMLVLPQLALW